MDYLATKQPGSKIRRQSVLPRERDSQLSGVGLEVLEGKSSYLWEQLVMIGNNQ